MPDTTQERSTRRSRSRAQNASPSAPAASRRSRAPREPLDRVVSQLDQMVSALIKENRELRRQVERASRQTAGDTSGAADRILRSIQRRISRAGESGRTSTSRRRAAAAAPATRSRRKITDPEVLERRRQALAKARAARAAKRAASS